MAKVVDDRQKKVFNMLNLTLDRDCRVLQSLEKIYRQNESDLDETSVV